MYVPDDVEEVPAPINQTLRHMSLQSVGCKPSKKCTGKNSSKYLKRR